MYKLEYIAKHRTLLGLLSSLSPIVFVFVASANVSAWMQEVGQSSIFQQLYNNINLKPLCEKSSRPEVCIPTEG